MFNVRLTPLEKKVLNALYDSADGNGHDFGFIEEARPAVESPRQLGGVVTSLIKKGLILVSPEVINGLTQFQWDGLNNYGSEPDTKGVLAFVRATLGKTARK